jgi:hypothetical protein
MYYDSYSVCCDHAFTFSPLYSLAVEFIMYTHYPVASADLVPDWPRLKAFQ